MNKLNIINKQGYGLDRKGTWKRGKSVLAGILWPKAEYYCLFVLFHLYPLVTNKRQ